MNDFFKNFAIKVFNRVPDRLVFPPSYFKVVNTIKCVSEGSGKGILLCKQQLALVLRDALTNVPYYRERIISPRKINAENAEDVLRSFPLLEKANVMESPEKFVSDRYKLGGLTVGTSGGSTGQGIKIYTNYTQRVIERAFFDCRWNAVSGWRRSSPLARIGCNGIKPEESDPFGMSGDKTLISPYHINSRWLHVIVSEVARRKIQYFHAYPSCFEIIVDYMIDAGVRNSCVRGIFLASERISEKLLEKIPMAFPVAKVIFHYGLTERTNLAWGEFVAGKISYRFDPAYGFSENFIHDNGHAEIVGTNYWNDVMPLIRYRTQDFGLIKDGEMSQLDGRAQEFLITRDGARIPGFSISIAKPTWKEVKFFQVVQNFPGRLEFHLVARYGNISEQVKQDLLKDQRAKWGGFFDMEIIEDKAIPLTGSGKTRLIVVNING